MGGAGAPLRAIQEGTRNTRGTHEAPQCGASGALGPVWRVEAYRSSGSASYGSRLPDLARPRDTMYPTVRIVA
jgi:hypothetical protein